MSHNNTSLSSNFPMRIENVRKGQKMLIHLNVLFPWGGKCIGRRITLYCLNNEVTLKPILNPSTNSQGEISVEVVFSTYSRLIGKKPIFLLWQGFTWDGMPLMLHEKNTVAYWVSAKGKLRPPKHTIGKRLPGNRPINNPIQAS